MARMVIAAGALSPLALSVDPASSLTRDTKPWHVLKPLTCCFDDNTGTAAFVESYETRQQCMIAALRLARKPSSPGCSAASCGFELWCLNVDENGLSGSMTQLPLVLAQPASQSAFDRRMLDAMDGRNGAPDPAHLYLLWQLCNDGGWWHDGAGCNRAVPDVHNPRPIP